MKKTIDKTFWDERYENEKTGWDIGYISTPLKEYIGITTLDWTMR